MLSVDYSQIEILIAALLCKEPRLIDAVLNGDVHTFVGSLVFHVPEAELDKRHRSMAKAASFTLLFAGGVPGIMESAAKGDVVLTIDEAREVRDKFFAAFPAVARYIAGTRSMVEYRQRIGAALNVRVPSGPLRSVFGKSLTASTVINTMIQGAAACGLKRALALIVARGLGPYLCAVVHDECVLDVPRVNAEEIKREVEQCLIEGMESIIGIRPKVGSTLKSQWG
jgi:DNA polymerase-1